MVQAARSGVQNIAEGSQASGTSKKTELKLTKVARASLEELRLDYGRFFTAAGAADMGAESTLHIPLTYNGVLERNMPMGQITSKLEKRLEDVKAGVFGNTTVFATPPKTSIVVAAFLLDYADKRTKWEQGGIAQKDAYEKVVTAGRLMLDDFADYVDETADGNITIIKMAGYNATFDPEILLPKGGINRIDGITFRRIEDAPGQMVSENGTLPKGTTAIGILSEGVPLPDDTVIDSTGSITIPGIFTANVKVNMTKQNKKFWINLKNGVTYYVYHVAVTAKGVSLLSVAVSAQCI